ncbi:MAG: rod shape-determining protein RodA [Patescibacteria group bacterium]
MTIKAVFKNISFNDWLFFLSVFILLLIGLMVYYSLAAGNFSINQIWEQILIYLIALALFWWAASFDYRILKDAHWILYVISLLLLIFVLLIGTSQFGAKRWIDLGWFNFQPVEVVKCLFIIFLARYFSQQGEIISWRDLLLSILFLGGLVILTMIQPDLGSSLVLVVIWLGMVLASNTPRRYLGILLLITLLLLPLFWVLMHDYQRDRILTFFDPMRDPYGAGYNVLQSQIAVGSGGWWGLGLGRGLQSQLHFLPVAYSDFAFAVLAEEFGFVGSIITLIFFGTMIAWIWQVAFRAVDQFGFFLVIGVGSMFIFQIFINVAMNLGIMPVTGIPLPFISSGGTSLLVVMFLLGLVMSVKKRSLAVSY